jgi:transcriptional regulator with XRE-family HTH domain
MNKTVSPASTPAAIEEMARHLGANISLARRRRHWRQEDLAIKAGISRVTLHKIEHGEISTGLGAYLAVLWALGLDREIDRIATPEADREGATLEAARLGQRVRLSHGLSDDF